MKTSNKPIANPNVVLREEFDDWAVLFNPDTADAIGTNPVGVAVWKWMDGRRNLEEIVKEIQKEFDNVPGTALEDVQKFIDELAEKGYVGYQVESLE